MTPLCLRTRWTCCCSRCKQYSSHLQVSNLTACAWVCCGQRQSHRNDSCSVVWTAVVEELQQCSMAQQAQRVVHWLRVRAGNSPTTADSAAASNST